MPPLFANVASGTTASPAITLPRGERAFSITCPSNGVACGVTIGFAVSSGTGPWASLAQWNSTGGAVVIHSGNGDAVGVVLTPPSPWCRVQLSNAPSATMSYQLNEIANR